MAEARPVSIDVAGGRALDGVLHLPDRAGRRPLVVICHGFKGFMDWGFFPYLAELLSERGFAALRFNLTSSGMRPGGELVSDVAAFRDTTLSQDLDELAAVLGHAADGLDCERIDPDRIGLFGHSRGGGTAILAAATSPWRERLGALVTWAALSTFDRYDAAQKAAWRRHGEMPVVNARTGQELALGRRVLEDFEARRDALDVGAAAERVAAPWLLVHGEDDETVPVAETDVLVAATGGRAERLRIPGGTHTFNVDHPFNGPSRELVRAMNATQSWFRRQLAATPVPSYRGSDAPHA